LAQSETEIYVRPRDCKFDASDLPIIQNLIGLGYSEADIGMILGYQGSNWKISAGKSIKEYKDAINAGLQAADANMVKELNREAYGYDWYEETINYKAVSKYDPVTGEESIEMVPTGKKVVKKHQPGNARLAELLACNRLPDLFKKVSELKKSSFDLKLEGEATEQQIEGLIGRLLEVVQKRKVIESETVNES